MAERITIIQFVEKYTRQFASNTFLWEKDGKEWTATTFEQTRKEAYRIAAGLMALGVQKGEKVSLLSEGRNLWVLGELGILYAGAVNVHQAFRLEICDGVGAATPENQEDSCRPSARAESDSAG